eukprot:TRINITY_DN3099_c0_g1_i4.p1 TRINITY_DN3099_c0_g1~~TRINITY_DN3099_c0_g1_i4.p1  ORF type:complete len:262 (+),score=6.89 TRINITY_DN3099_c0_g1_i4:109-894(+)
METLPVPKFRNPYQVYRMLGDISISVCMQNIPYEDFGLRALTYYKNLLKIEYDHKTRAVNLLYGSTSSHLVTTDWRYVVQRLESFGDERLKGLADTLSTYYQLYTQFLSCLPLINDLNEFTDGTFDSKNFLEEFSPTDVPSLNLYTETVKLPFGIDQKLTIISFNEKFMQMLGYNMSELVERCLSKGTPQIFPCEYYNQFLQCFLDISCRWLKNPETYGQPMKFVTYLEKKSKRLVKVEVSQSAVVRSKACLCSFRVSSAS